MDKSETLKNKLANIKIFSDCSSFELDRILNNSEITRVKADVVIINEGELADSLYIINSGSAQVFSSNENGKVVILARLNAGDYFGEQAYLDNFIRTASVRALTDLELLKISYSELDLIFNKHTESKEILKKIALGKHLNSLKMQSQLIESYLDEILVKLQMSNRVILDSYHGNFIGKMYLSLRNIIQKIFHTLSTKQNETSEVTVRYFKKNEIIFKKGAPSDFVYIISSGSVALTFEDVHTEKRQVILNKNQIFGEVGVLNNKPRAATAIALQNSAIIVITGDEFIKASQEHKGLKSVTTSIGEIYSLPQYNGIATQFVTNVDKVETIHTIYVMENTKRVECVKVINQPIFAMKILDEKPDKVFSFKKGLIERTVSIKDNLIVGIEVVGEWDEINILCEMILNAIVSKGMSFDLFEKTGNLLSLSSNSYVENEIICNCMSVDAITIKKCINKGLENLNQISEATGASTVCGGCRNKILDMLNLSPWRYATIILKQQFNADTCAFIIKSIYSHFPKFKAGQYISLKLLIDNLWVERCYTLTSPSDKDDCYEIMVKKYDKGTFSPWLFDHKNVPLFVWISQPNGEFVLRPSKKPILCFAGGVGITPFVAYLREIINSHSTTKIYLIYSVKSKLDATLPDDIINLSNDSNILDMELWDVSLNGLLTKEHVKNKIDTLDPEYVYICGPTAFTTTVTDMLAQINFNANNIITEKFISVSEKAS